MRYGPEAQKEIDKLRKLLRYANGRMTHWCPIVSSHEIKRAIIERCNELGVSIMEVCLRADVSYNTVNRFYVNDDEPKSRPAIRPEDIIKIAELIGIKIRVRAFMKPAAEIDTTKLLNENFIPNGKRKKNKKLD